MGLEDKNFTERYDCLSKLVINNKQNKIKLVDTVKIEDKISFFESIDATLNKYVKDGYEGIMLRKSLRNPMNHVVVDGYQYGKRSNNLIKHKCFKQEEFEVVDIVKHREKEMVGAFVLKIAHQQNEKGEPLVFHAAPGKIFFVFFLSLVNNKPYNLTFGVNYCF